LNDIVTLIYGLEVT